MRFRYAIFVLMFTGLSGFAQQTPPSQPSSQSKPPANAQQQKDTKPSPDETNPFPEAVSRKAEDAANGTSSAAKSGSSSSHIDMKRFDEPEGSESRISDGAGGFIHDPELAAKDDKVGQFYLQNGDYKGAYDRYKEATEVAPEDGNAVFGLAESARGLHRTQEAVSNYTLYLDAFPDGKKSKDARKALDALGGAKKK
jgi:tetratricopeptide (TPR) repeat protein